MYFLGYDGYETELVRLLKRLLLSKTIVFDIGANIGYYTLLAAHMLRGRGAVYAFEPWPLLFAALQRNVGLNRFDHVHLNQLAVSDSDGVTALYLPAPTNGDMHLSNASLVQGFMPQDRSISVHTVRFDAYCSSQNITSVDLVKIDTEGAELMVLLGMGTLLEKWMPDIIIEVLDSYAEQIDSFLRPYGYRAFLITNYGLTEVRSLQPHPRFRDYYLSVSPPSALVG